MKQFLIGLIMLLAGLGPARAQDPSHAAIYPQLGHSDSVLTIAFSPDGKAIASGGADYTIKIWDVVSGRERRTLSGHADRVESVALSPDGKMLASASDDNTVRLWDVASARPLATLKGHTNWVRSVAFSLDGKMLASGSDDHTIRLWDVASASPLGVLSGHSDGVISIAFSPDGKALASGSYDNTIRFWDVAGRRQRLVLKGHADSVTSVAFSPDGNALASGSADKTIRRWDVASGRELGMPIAQPLAVNSVAFSPNGKVLAAGGDDKTVRLWDLPGGREPRALIGHATAITSVAVSPDGKILASASGDKTVKLWDLTSGHLVRALSGHASGSTAVAFSADGRFLASGGRDGSVTLFDLASGRVLRALSGNLARVTSVAFSPDGTIIASAGQDKSIRLWNAADGLALHTIAGAEWVSSVAFSPDGKVLASGNWNDGVDLWDVASGRALRTLNGHSDSVTSVAFSHDGKWLASGSDDNTIRIWDAASGQALRTLSGHVDWIYSVAFSPDGRTLASGSDDHTIKLWDVASGRELNTLNGHLGLVSSVAFTPDGRALTSGGSDGTTRVWDVSTGKARAAFVGFDDGSSIAVTPEGFFDSSSESAEEGLNVRIGDRVFGISSFRETFYRPDLVQAALAGESLAQEGGIDTVKLSPVVELLDMPHATGAATFEVKVRLADGGGGFGPVRVFRDGTAILQENAAATSGDTLIRSYPTPLFSGVNDLRVTASNADGSMWSEATAQVTSDLPVRVAAHGTLHALVVGIQTFPQRPDNNLTYPTADAQLVASTLRTRAAPLFEKVDIQLLIGASATDRDHVIGALKAMQAEVGPDDEFVFYVASHGLVADGVYYLATSNLVSADPARLKVDAISSKTLSDLLANIPATRKLVIIDTCDAGAAGQTLAASRGLRARDAVTILGRTFGLTVLAATNSNQEAIEGGYQGHGLFTYVVADGLSGKAADATTGVVSSFLLADYVGDQVPLLAQTVLHRDQQPTPVESGQSFPVTKVR